MKKIIERNTKRELTTFDKSWKVHTSNLLEEILTNKSATILHKPLAIFGRVLAEVGERAAELNDPILNELMCRLTIYEIADQTKSTYDKAAVAEVAKRADEYRKANR